LSQFSQLLIKAVKYLQPPIIYLLAVFIFVAFRSSRPDLATVWEVLKELRDNNIDESQLVEWSSNRCAMLICLEK
jgi:hypothetical protein